jgi:TolB protein
MFILSVHLFADFDTTIRIEKDVDKRSKVVVLDESIGIAPHISGKFFDLFSKDLKISGNFISDKIHYISSDTSIDLNSKDYIIKYKLNLSAGANLSISLLEVSSKTLIFSKKYSIPSFKKYPFLAHQAVSDINDALHYQPISWINRYVIFSRYSGSKQSQIVLADYSMTYQKVLISGGLNLFPKWADKNQKSIYYTSYSTLRPTLYKLNIYSGNRSFIASSEGMIVCSDVSRDGTKILVTMAPNGHADIYEIDTLSGLKKRITTFTGIDVNGNYSDNESSIVYVSNPLGYANIYKKPINGSGVSQIVFHGRNNNSCDTNGNKIVYSSRESSAKYSDNRFNIYLASSSGTRPLTTTGVNQFPKFSPNGKIILYVKSRGGSSSVGYINLISKKTLIFPLYGKKIQSIDW